MVLMNVKCSEVLSSDLQFTCFNANQRLNLMKLRYLALKRHFNQTAQCAQIFLRFQRFDYIERQRSILDFVLFETMLYVHRTDTHTKEIPFAQELWNGCLKFQKHDTDIASTFIYSMLWSSVMSKYCQKF
jgi:hypothetical protein